MFKSWIRDVMESKRYTEKKMNTKYREPGKPNTLVGTDGFLSYVKTMVPGVSYGKEFINKYRKK
jgi:hypothetical protein